MSPLPSARRPPGQGLGPSAAPRPGPLVAVVLAAILAASPSDGRGQTLPETEACVSCHLGLQDSAMVAPARQYLTDVHAEAGFGCLVCHGGPRTGRGRLSPDAGFLSVPDRAEVPALCGRCHSDAAFMRDYDPSIRVDQVTEYYTSVHGTLLREGDPDVATCVSCHPAHRILPPSDLESSVHPLNVGDLCGSCHADEGLMAPRNEPTDQLEDYRRSVHGHLLYEEGDVSAPTCNDCHGNHGAAPPGIGSVQNVCGQCHTVMAQYFDESRHEETFEESGFPGCELCHGNHAVLPPSDAFLTNRSDSVCGRCHEPGDPAGDAFLVMATLIDSLKEARAEAREVLEDAENLGMEVSQGLFELEEVDNALTKARSAVHSFHVEPVQQEVEAGFEITRGAAAEGVEALEEHGFRRVGLAVSAAIILLLIIALVLRMRSIEEQMDRLFASIDRFFEDAVIAAVTGDAGADRDEAIRLAACGLLLEIAYADAEFTDDEREHLESAIRTQFGLDREEAHRLATLAEAQREAGAGLHRFTILINRHFDAEAKRALMEAMWGLVYADGVLTEHEERIMDRIADLLGQEPTRPRNEPTGPTG